MNPKSTDNLPRLAIWLLRKAVYYDYRDCATGDFAELYLHMLRQEGPLRARLYIWTEVIRSLPGFINNSIYWSFAMLSNYVKIALRSMKRHKAHTLINITGLAVGFACTILTALFVIHELSYDRFHENADRIYRIAQPDDVSTPPPLARTMQADYSQVKAAASFANHREKRVKYQDRVFYESPVLSTTNECFELFSFPLLRGDRASVLKEPNTVVLTQSMATRYFGNEDPMHQVITVGDDDYRIVGVMEDVPENAHFRFECLLSSHSYSWYEEDRWGSNFMTTYILLRDPSEAGYIESQLPEFITKYISGGDPEADDRYIMQPLTSIHLHSKLRFELGNNGDIRNIIVFSTAALLMVIIAGINFMNLTTAKSLSRVNEIGIRKALGSQRRQLILQFLGESILMSLLALVVGIIIVYAILPVYHLLVGRQIDLAPISPWTAALGLVGSSIVVGIFAGSYPAFYVSSFRPVQVIRGNLTKRKTSSRFRNGLVVFQFVVSIVLLIGTFTVYRQLHFMQNKDLGFGKDQVLVVKNLEPDPLKSESLRQKLRQHANIVSVSSSGNLPGKQNGRQAVEIEGAGPSQLNMYSVDYDYMQTLQLEMAEGRFFSREFGTDTAGIILNEHAVRAHSMENPIGKRITVNVGRTIQGTVIGVVKDFHFRSLHEPIGSLGMVYGIKKGWGINFVSVRLNTNDVTSTIQYIREAWESVNPATPFDYTFLDDSYASLHASERTTGSVALVFCFLTAIVCCLGLYGLSTFVIERRVKEIGIRKVLGASVSGTVWMLSRNFLRWVLLAFVLAAPLAWIVMGRWLQNFAYKVDLEVWVFGVSGALALLIALATVGFQSLKVALANPVDSLKHE